MGDGYAQLVAEFMLQQTQVATVIPYYERFLTRFPTIEHLVAAPLDEVLALWSGLGYYSRARNLHAAAQKVVADHGGRVPAAVETLMELPGVGRYTAGAIASIAYDVRAPVLDGNVGRVLMRVLAIDADPKAPATRALLWETAEALLPRARCGDFNQALMELGATVCSPKAPNCLLCPLQGICRAALEDLTDRIPPPVRRSKVKPVQVLVAAIEWNGRLLFVQRPSEGLWAGLWELPSEVVEEGEPVTAALQRLHRRVPSGQHLSRQPVGKVTRLLTHREMTFHIYRTAVEADAPARIPIDSRWVRPGDWNGLAISRACQAVVEFLRIPRG
ncbi:MAG: A/G-specific adenine glycosylase [Phycisphaerae bacterium]